MRRIPRPQRSIDQTIPISQLLRPQISASPCRAVLSSSPLLRTTSAPFSTSPRYGLFEVKRDKKKHQAMVRKWQKRLLGEAEPIGAHVDPYDPTSPVRIAPEETGEEVEVLDDSRTTVLANGEVIEELPYEAAETAEGLKRVGGKAWLQEQEEAKLAQRFERLLARPSPIVNYHFGPEEPLTNRRTLLSKFHQAVVEVYTLKEAGKDMDLAKHPSQGEYGGLPFSLGDVKLSASKDNELVLVYPSAQAQAELLKAIQEAPKLEVQEQEAEDMAELQEELFDEAEAVPKAPEVPTPAVKAGPLMKQTEGKPFDFMSNRPVPRVTPAAPTPQEVPPTAAKVVEAVQAAQKKDLDSVAEESRKTVAALRHSVLDTAAQTSEQAVTSMHKAVRGHITSLASDNKITVIEPMHSIRLRQIHIPSPDILFALSKRLLSLTGHRIPDHPLYTSRTLGDIFSHLVEASKPKPVTLSQKLRAAHDTRLQKLPNVKMYRRKLDTVHKEKQVGRWKVIEYALTERGLPVHARDAPKMEAL